MKKPKIFTLHFAGGNRYSLQFLTPELHGLEVIALELPGRGMRMAEDLIHQFEPAAENILQQILPHLDNEPFLLYGHSMGAILGLKVTHMLEQRGAAPAALVISGCAPPDGKRFANTYQLNTPDFKQTLKKLGGITAEVLNNEALFSVFEPILRADFEIAERAWNNPWNPINIPLYVVIGSDDICTDSTDDWRPYTTADFTLESLPGDHFFIHHHKARLADIILSQLN